MRWKGLFIGCTLLVALAVTTFDAFLLQQKKAFFTGGFLSSIHTNGALEAIGFLLTTFLIDAGAAALLVAAALWITGRFTLTPLARIVAVVALALTPFLVDNFIRYRLLTYLGDAFDLSLMFDLTGRRPSEFLAVSSQHLLGPALMFVAAIGAGCAGIWAINRFGPGASRAALAVPLRAFALGVLAFTVAGVGAAAARISSETFEDGLRRKPSGSLYGQLTEVVTDVDRDGFGVGDRMSDPDPFDAGIFPYAIDVPGDGIDQNGVAGDLPAGSAYSENPTATAPWQRKPDVILIVLESFRADAVGRTVNGRAVTPVMDALARGGVSVPLAFSHNGYTAESRFHILTGSIIGLRQGTSLIDDFKANGYEVGYFSGQDDSFGGHEYAVGMERADFAYDARQDRKLRYSTFTTAGSLAVPHNVVTERIGEFLARRDRTKPLFLYINFHDTHYPYRHDGMRPLISSAAVEEGDIHPSRAAALQEMYFNSAANVDAAIGATLQMIQGHLGHTPGVIVTADHGESLYDEGFLGHGYALNDVQTRIPLIVSGLGLRIEEPVGQVELRDLIGTAMSSTDGDDRPSVVTRGDKRVFQYLGTLTRPRQIGFVTAGGREIYDFRNGRMRIGADGWQRPETLSGAAATQFTEIVRLWERMMLARASD